MSAGLSGWGCGRQVVGRDGRVARAPRPPFQTLNPLEIGNWDELVLAHENATIFHSQAWARVLHDTYHHTPFYFGGLENNRLLSLLPIMQVSSPFTGRRGVSLPFTDLCEALGVDDNTTGNLFRQAIESGQAWNWRYLEVRGWGGNLGQPEPFLSFHGHALDLSQGADAVFKTFHSSVRRAIRKAETAGVQVNISSSLDAVRTYYALHCRTRKSHGVPPQPLRFFDNIRRHILEKGHGFLVTANHEGRPIASAVFFHFGRGAIYKFGASKRAFQELRGNNLVIWRAIQHCCQLGCGSLHFGRTSLQNEGLRKFKLGWATTEHRIDCWRYDLSKQAFAPGRDHAEEGWHKPLFRLLPIPLARLAGAILYRHAA